MRNSSDRPGRPRKYRRKKQPGPVKIILRVLFVVFLILSALYLLYRGRTQGAGAIPPLQENSPAGLSVTFLDVGQGDSTLVVCGGEAMLIDGGSPEYSSLLYSVLKSKGISRLRYVAATHPHSDHVGGLPGALSYADADEALCNTAEYDSASFTAFLNALRKKDVPLRIPQAGESFPLGSAEITVLGPLEHNELMNDNSLVFRIRYGDISFLVTGDCQMDEESSLLDAEKAGMLPCPLRSTVLKAGHHGSSDASSFAFLEAVSPAYAVISCGTGEENPFGHPHDRTLKKLEDLDVKILRTDRDGDIRFFTDGAALSVETGKKEPGTGSAETSSSRSD